MRKNENIIQPFNSAFRLVKLLIHFLTNTNYGHAGAINYYRKQFDLPEAYSFNSSYIIWAPSEVEFDNQILIDDRLQNGSTWFNSMILADSKQNPFTRDPGYIYYRKDPKIDVALEWKNLVEEEKAANNF